METIIQQNNTKNTKSGFPMMPDYIKREIRSYFLRAAGDGFKVSWRDTKDAIPGYSVKELVAKDSEDKSAFIAEQKIFVCLNWLRSHKAYIITVHTTHIIEFGYSMSHQHFDGSDITWLEKLAEECKHG